MKEMKDSDIEWIGEIPKEWEVIKLKTCIRQRDSGAWGNEASGNEGDTICLRIADFNYAMFRFKDTEEGLLTKRNYNGAVIKNLLLQKNDIVIEKSGGGEKTPVGRTVIFDKDYKAVYANFCDRLRCRRNVLPWFMQYIFVTFYLNGYVWNYIKQTTGIQNLDLTAMLASEKIALPTLVEQQKIVDFLNVCCKEIDNVIAKTRASIEEYRKLKQAVITRAVTKGIDENREMKDSSIEWLGNVPADWNLIKITRLLDYGHLYPIGDGDHGLIKTDDYIDAGVPYIRVQNLGWGTELNYDNIVYISEEKNQMIANSILKPNDILFAKTGATIGKTAIVPDSMPVSNTTSHIGKITVSSDYNPRFVFYVMSSYVVYRQFWEIAGLKSTRPELSIDEMKKIRLTIPSTLEEQDRIVKYLDKICKDLDELIYKKESYLAEIENYKKSLIYEYVTGKKRV